MIVDADTIAEVFHTARRNPLRTFLTACGVFWGVFMLIVMVGVGQGLNNYAAGEMAGFSRNTMFVWGRATSLPSPGYKPGRRIRFVNEDITALKQRVPEIEALAPSNLLGGWPNRAKTIYGIRSGEYRVMASYPVAIKITKLAFPNGRFLNQADLENKRKVCVIGRRVYKELMPYESEPLGKYVEIAGVQFQVVGIAHSLGAGERAERDEQTIHVPFTTYQQAFNEPNRVHWFQILAKPEADAGKVEANVRKVLMERHKVNPEDSRALGSFNAGEEFKKVTTLFTGISMIIWVVGLLTLLAGVVGVCNIMLISIRERYAEIGLRKALGARPRQIVSMVLAEATVLTVSAGYLAIVVGVGVLEVLGWFAASGDAPIRNPQASLSAALLAAGTLSVAGILAGILPAMQAARVSPIESLRDE